MGKHSIEKEKKKINFKREIIAILIIIALVFGINFVLSHRNLQKDQTDAYTEIKNLKTIEGKRLVIKSNSEYNKIIEYIFEKDVLKTVKIYEQLEKKEEFDQKKNNYEITDSIEIININEKELSIEIEKKDLGSETGKTYEEIYDKYLVQIIGAYQIIK